MFTTISKIQYEALHHHNAATNKTKYRKSAITSINEMNSNGITSDYKIILMSILSILGAEIYIVQDELPEESLGEDPMVYFESTHDVFWRIINEFLTLAKLKVNGTPLTAANKVLAKGPYIDVIRTPSSDTEHKIIILVTLINLFAETKIEPDRPFNTKTMHIHKSLDVLLKLILLFDKNKC